MSAIYNEVENKKREMENLEQQMRQIHEDAMSDQLKYQKVVGETHNNSGLTKDVKQRIIDSITDLFNDKKKQHEERYKIAEEQLECLKLQMLLTYQTIKMTETSRSMKTISPMRTKI